ncbi:MAG: TetR/AcrR family transcriptional regulator [Clostridium sp.]|nr:TetR/AcrR family transcriptional regulator [Clostridium sp.]
MVLKTREKLIDVARRLFARKGVENTTMNDIAEASDKGRRTVYTYFKNKRDIYNAVIEKESENLLARLREVASLTISPVEKLERYLKLRFEILAQLAGGQDGFWSIFTPDGRKIARARRLAQAKERDLFRSVISEGVKSGDFDPDQSERLPKIESFIFEMIGMASTRTDFDSTEKSIAEVREPMISFFINGLIRKNNQFSTQTYTY